jgi:hypothetical protein
VLGLCVGGNQAGYERGLCLLVETLALREPVVHVRASLRDRKRPVAALGERCRDR